MINHRRWIDATHIFDGLNDFPTHVAHMRFGAFVTLPTPWPFSTETGTAGQNTALYNVALQWLKEDREFRKELEKNGRKVRGARKDETVSVSQASTASCTLSVLPGTCGL